MTVRDCNDRMDFVNRHYYGNQCKRVNTFIAGPNLDCRRCGLWTCGDTLQQAGRL
uniref:Uncharacterized protein n=1 Tax=Anguilla anguilla TaxID=7936 RepID=A0A0E9XU22_ANGAN